MLLITKFLLTPVALLDVIGYSYGSAGIYSHTIQRHSDESGSSQGFFPLLCHHWLDH